MRNPIRSILSLFRATADYYDSHERVREVVDMVVIFAFMILLYALYCVACMVVPQWSMH